MHKITCSESKVEKYKISMMRESCKNPSLSIDWKFPVEFEVPAYKQGLAPLSSPENKVNIIHFCFCVYEKHNPPE